MVSPSGQRCQESVVSALRRSAGARIEGQRGATPANATGTGCARPTASNDLVIARTVAVSGHAVIRADLQAMSIDSACTDCAGQVQTAQSLAVLQQAMKQQKVEGQAALDLIAASQSQVAPPPPAPGTGGLVDVMA